MLTNFRRGNYACSAVHGKFNMPKTKHAPVEVDAPLPKRQKSKEPADDLLTQLNEAFLVKHPPALLELWHHAKRLNEKRPTDAFADI